MSKRKKNEKVETLEEVSTIQKELVIDSEENAIEFYKAAKYQAPEGVDFAYVTSDKNVFWPDNGGSAKTHAFQNKLKIFKIKVNGLIESND